MMNWLITQALSLIKQAWKSIPREDYDRFRLVLGRYIDSQTKMMIGEPYFDGISTPSGRKQYRTITKYKGDKSCCRKVNILKKYPFPEYSYVKFVGESTIWEKIN